MKHASLRRPLALLLTLCLVMTVTAFTTLAEAAPVPHLLASSEALTLNTIKSGKIDKESARITEEEELNYNYCDLLEGDSYKVFKLAVKANGNYLFSFLSDSNLSTVVMMSDVRKALDEYVGAYEGVSILDAVQVGEDQLMTSICVTPLKDCNIYFVLATELTDDTDVCNMQAKAIDLSAKRVYDQEITISSKADLLALANRDLTLNDEHLKVSFKNDIDLTGTTWPGIASFSGLMEGNGHKITGLTTESMKDLKLEDTVVQHSGLTTNAMGATFRNLSIEAVYPDRGISTDGAFCSVAANCTFENCKGTAKITDSVFAISGGLCAIAENCVFQDCTGNLNFIVEKISSDEMGNMASGIGGLVGQMTSCKAYDSKGTLTCKTKSILNNCVGGFAGTINASLTDGCSGNIDFSGVSGMNIGGFAGGKNSDMFMSLSANDQTNHFDKSTNQFRNCWAEGKIDVQLTLFRIEAPTHQEISSICESLGGFIGNTDNDSYLNCYATTDVYGRDFSAETKASVISRAKKADASFAQGNKTDDEFFHAALEILDIYDNYQGGGTNVGGFAGQATAPVMDNCYAGGDVTGGSWDDEMDAGLFFGSLHTGEFPIVSTTGEETTETTNQTEEELLAGIKNIYWNTNAKLIWSSKTMKPASCGYLYSDMQLTSLSLDQEELPKEFVEHFEDNGVNFSDSAAVSKMTAALNKRAGELSNCSTWAGSNAKKAPMLRCYTITFQNEKGEAIGTIDAFPGEDISSRAVAVPEKKGYTGKWNASLSSVNGNMTIGVTYTKNDSNTTKPGSTTKPGAQNNGNPGTGSAGAMGAGAVLLLAGAVLVLCKKRNK